METGHPVTRSSAPRGGGTDPQPQGRMVALPSFVHSFIQPLHWTRRPVLTPEVPISPPGGLMVQRERNNQRPLQVSTLGV